MINTGDHKKEERKQYGFIKDVPSEKDYVFGASGVPMTVLVEDGDWTPYLPDKEYQNLNGVEPYACVTFTILNAVETLIFKQYGIRKNFSDRFLAAISGTKEQQGNSPREVGDALRKHGVTLEEVWPFSSDVSTYETYYAEIPDEARKIAKEFTDEWVFSYESVPTNPDAISAALKCSPLLMSVYAWLEGPDGRYIRPQGYSDIHATTLFYERQGEFRRVFDTYADGLGDPAIKDVHWDAMPEVVKRFYIKKRDKALEISLLSQLLGLYQKLLELLKLAKNDALQSPVSPPEIPVSVPVPAEKPAEPKYKWGTPQEVRKSIRVIGDEEKLLWDEKDTICAVIQAESGFNTKAINKNTDGTTDYGLCQFNSYWYIEKMKLITKDQALNDPEFSVRLMIKRFNQGFLKDWSAFKNGSYKQYL